MVRAEMQRSICTIQTDEGGVSVGELIQKGITSRGETLKRKGKGAKCALW